MPKNTNCSTTCQNILNILILQQFHFHHNSSLSNLYVIWFWQRMLSTSIILTKQAYIIHLYTKSPRCQNSNDNGPVQLLLSQNKRPKIEKTPSQISLKPKIPQKLSPKTFTSVIIPHFHWLPFSHISQQPNKYPNGYP